MLNKFISKFLVVIVGLTCDAIMSIPVLCLRRAYFRMVVKSCGKHVYVGRNLDLRHPRGIIVGDYVMINKRVLLDGRNGIVIGNNVDIAQDAFIWTCHHNYNDDFHSVCGERVCIGDFAWICSRSIVLPGVIIGKGAVVASNAVVTKDVPAMMVVGGVPAKIIAKRESKLLYKLTYRPHFYDKL